MKINAAQCRRPPRARLIHNCSTDQNVNRPLSRRAERISAQNTRKQILRVITWSWAPKNDGHRWKNAQKHSRPWKITNCLQLQGAAREQLLAKLLFPVIVNFAPFSQQYSSPPVYHAEVPRLLTKATNNEISVFCIEVFVRGWIHFWNKSKAILVVFK
jgi:hypothetical protein